MPISALLVLRFRFKGLDRVFGGVVEVDVG